mmetsp:Transcript_30453/g.94525  ORF Transcript_30453/g.94525 Transcript_30453/m.94525 type:complete len:658 (-) Transcript_30453:230-2203(-)
MDHLRQDPDEHVHQRDGGQRDEGHHQGPVDPVLRAHGLHDVVAVGDDALQKKRVHGVGHGPEKLLAHLLAVCQLAEHHRKDVDDGEPEQEEDAHRPDCRVDGLQQNQELGHCSQQLGHAREADHPDHSQHLQDVDVNDVATADSGGREDDCKDPGVRDHGRHQEAVEDEPEVAHAAPLVLECHESDEELEGEVRAEQVLDNLEAGRRSQENRLRVVVDVDGYPDGVREDDHHGDVLEEPMLSHGLSPTGGVVVVGHVVLRLDEGRARPLPHRLPVGKDLLLVLLLLLLLRLLVDGLRPLRGLAGFLAAPRLLREDALPLCLGRALRHGRGLGLAPGIPEVEADRQLLARQGELLQPAVHGALPLLNLLLEFVVQLYLDRVHRALELVDLRHHSVRLPRLVAEQLLEAHVHGLLLNISPDQLLYPGEELVDRALDLLLKTLHRVRDQRGVSAQRLLYVEHLLRLPLRARGHLLLERAEVNRHAAQLRAEAGGCPLLLLLEPLDLAAQKSHLLAELPLYAVEPSTLGAELLVHGPPIDLGGGLHLLLKLGHLGEELVVKQGVGDVREPVARDGEDLLSQRRGLLAEALLADPEEVAEWHVANQTPLLVGPGRLVFEGPAGRPLQGGVGARAVAAAHRGVLLGVDGSESAGILPRRLGSS